MSLRLPIHDILSRKFGTLRDVSVTGLRVAGIEYQVGDITTFYLPTDIFVNADSLLVVADCRWVSRKNQKTSWLVSSSRIYLFCRSAGAPAIYQLFVTEQIRTMEYLEIVSSYGRCSAPPGAFVLSGPGRLICRPAPQGRAKTRRFYLTSYMRCVTFDAGGRSGSFIKLTTDLPLSESCGRRGRGGFPRNRLAPNISEMEKPKDPAQG